MAAAKVPMNFKSDYNIDEESKKEMLRQVAIIKGVIPDDDEKVDDLDAYFKRLGV